MSRRRRPANNPRSAQRFWGKASAIGTTPLVVPAEDPAAVVASLGPPPLGIHSNSATHYLEAMYQKAAGVAVALAASADLLEMSDEAEPADLD